jgi:hypothetical protein
MKHKRIIIRNFSTKYLPTQDVQLVYTHYVQNNAHALTLLSMDGEPLMTASTNLDAGITNDEVVIKDYSENEGVRDTLIRAGVISEDNWFITRRYSPTHIVTFPVHVLLDMEDGKEIVL